MEYCFAKNLRKERKKRGMTQLELAGKVGVSQTTVSQWESTEQYPTLDKIYDIANVLKISVSALVDASS